MTLYRRLLLAYAVPLVVTMAAAVFVYRAFLESTQSARAVLESAKATSAVQRLLTLVVDAETGMRGFLLTGKDQSLAPYHAAIEELGAQREELARLVAHEADQMSRVRHIERLFSSWRNEVAEPSIAARRTSTDGFDIDGLPARFDGKARIRAIRHIAGEMTDVEEMRLGVRQEQSEWAARQGEMLALLVPGLAAVVALLLSFLLARHIARSLESVASAASGIVAGDLTRRVSVQGRDEIAQMAQAFNTLGDWMVARTGEMEALHRMGELLHSCASPDEVESVVVGLAPRLFPGTSGVIWMVDASRTHLSAAAAWGLSRTQAWGAQFAPDECWALRSSRTHVASPRENVPCAHSPEGEGATLTCIPLLAHGETLGVIQVKTAAEVFSGDMRRALESVAEHVALALSNLRLRETLRQESIRDALTGLYNRRYLEETLQRELARARRNESTVGVLFLDVDHFKRLNDTEGHEAGDAVLRSLGRLLIDSFRTSDAPCRYGGEELAVILPDISLEHLVARAKDMRDRVQRMGVCVGERKLGVTVSIGVALFPTHASDGEMLLRAADHALYAAKESGRNRVAIAESPSAGAGDVAGVAPFGATEALLASSRNA